MTLRKKQSAVIVLLLCASLGFGSAQKKANKKVAGEAPEAAKPIGVHEYQLEGVDLALMEVARTAPDVVTVKWEYRNKTPKIQSLATVSHGWSDPYRLAWDSYVLGPDGKTKIKLMKDQDGKPIAAVHGVAVKPITVLPNKTVKTWAKYAVPTGTKIVTVVLEGAEPFENVEITEPPPSKGK